MPALFGCLLSAWPFPTSDADGEAPQGPALPTGPRQAAPLRATSARCTASKVNADSYLVVCPSL